ncbi:hypothetical protein ACFORG_17085 [Lutimaribacter marinistellae]|uniref:Porin n=1 Tax=Lutimaribacter marinistellae TaxID=1820329 RepID=A0ABV7TMR1_9RHOB
MTSRMSVLLSAALLSTTALGYGPALAGVGPPPPPPPPAGVATNSSDTTLYVGLNLLFGSGAPTLEGILGVASGETDTSGDVTGGKAALHFRLNDGFGLRKFKITGLVGDEDVQGELGFGYNFESQSFLGVLGANGKYWAAGADYDFTTGLEGYIGAHSIEGF